MVLFGLFCRDGAAWAVVLGWCNKIQAVKIQAHVQHCRDGAAGTALKLWRCRGTAVLPHCQLALNEKAGRSWRGEGCFPTGRR